LQTTCSFERFLNPDRVSGPIESTFCIGGARSDEYVTQKYARKDVAQDHTLSGNHVRAKAAGRTFVRAMNSYCGVIGLANLIPTYPGIEVEKPPWNKPRSLKRPSIR